MTTIWRLAPPLPRRQLVAQLVGQCAAAGLSAPQERYRVGCWSWPLAWPTARLLVDLTAGRFHDGRLLRGLSRPSDAKRNAATLAGWRVLTFGPQPVADGTAVRQIAAALGALPSEHPGAVR
jgi:hypothetical protein